MGQLFATIRKLVTQDKYVVGKHAAEPSGWKNGASWNGGLLLAGTTEK
jgi:hypothetical protein